MLSPRQELLLGKVVDGFAATGQPVGSKALASDEEVGYGPSTIRNELAVLEELGLLAHPHTSAGRVPTDAGYRYFVDNVLPQRTSRAVEPRAPELTLARREVDEAMRVTTETLSQVTNLLAIVTAPPIATTTIRHVEVLALQPQVLMVVIITSTGGVSKRVFAFDTPVDPGLAEWAAAYLNDTLVGMGLGARMLHTRLEDPSLPATERTFLAQLAPAFTELAETAEDALYVDGAARLLSEYRFQDLTQLNAVMEMLEQRVTLLSVLSDALAERDTYVRIGQENAAPALHGLSLVAANYGLPRRNLGTVSVIGPTRMDYAVAIRAVRAAAAPALPLRRRRLRRVLMARDYYETLGVDRGADDAKIKKAFRKLARELHPDVNAHDPDAEEKFKEAAAAYEVLNDPERRRLYDAYGEDGLRGRGYAPDMDAFGSVSDLFSAFFGSGGFDAAFGAGRRGRGGGAIQGADVVVAATIDLADSARGTQVEISYEAAALCPNCHGNGAEPGTPIVDCPRCDGTGQHQRVARTAFGQLVRTSICDQCEGEGRGSPRHRAVSVRARAWSASRSASRSTSRPGSPTASGSGSRAAATRASAADRPATSTWSCGCARTSASCATARTS